MSAFLIPKIVEELETLPDDLKQQVLNFVRTLKTSNLQGASGNDLLQFAGAIPLDDLKLISQAIETDCERIDSNEW